MVHIINWMCVLCRHGKLALGTPRNSVPKQELNVQCPSSELCRTWGFRALAPRPGSPRAVFLIILVSFWCHLQALGCHWAAWGAPGGPPREPSWRDDEIIGLWLLLGVSSGTLLEPKSFSSRQYLIAKTTLKENLRQMLHERPSESIMKSHSSNPICKKTKSSVHCF